jgi:hypothetical protein
VAAGDGGLEFPSPQGPSGRSNVQTPTASCGEAQPIAGVRGSEHRTAAAITVVFKPAISLAANSWRRLRGGSQNATCGLARRALKVFARFYTSTGLAPSIAARSPTTPSSPYEGRSSRFFGLQ